MSSRTIDTQLLEKNRQKLQADLDRSRSLTERNLLGQFATPSNLAHEILKSAKHYLGDKTGIRFLDPAIGTGSFYSAFRDLFLNANIAEARGYEIDPYYGVPAQKLWKNSDLKIHLEDFTKVDLKEVKSKFDLIICNPPYVRHHHLDKEAKSRLKHAALSITGIEFSGLTGLYCYFVVLSHNWMAPSATAGWLIPSEFMDVKYGVALKNYLLDQVTLLQIHRFDPSDVQFGDALVSSALVWFRNDRPPVDHQVRMSFGSDLAQPSSERLISTRELRSSRKWTRIPFNRTKAKTELVTLSNFFKVKRGLVTGSNSFFILEESELKRRRLPMHLFQPILPSPRDLLSDVISGDDDGVPLIKKRLFVLNCHLPYKLVQRVYPTLYEYLEEGHERGIPDRYICRNRTIWYAQEHRPPAPFLCTYLGRFNRTNNSPFRFILNRSRATAANVYLMLYPIDAVVNALSKDSTLVEQTWNLLRKTNPEELINEGRVYGGGLYKLEPNELANVSAASIAKLFKGIETESDEPIILKE